MGSWRSHLPEQDREGTEGPRLGDLTRGSCMAEQFNPGRGQSSRGTRGTGARISSPLKAESTVHKTRTAQQAEHRKHSGTAKKEREKFTW